MKVRTSLAAALVSVALLTAVLISWGRQRSDADDPVVATYRGGTVRRSELVGWNDYRPMMTSERTEARFGLDSVRLAAVMKAGAVEAEALGLDRDPRWRFDSDRATAGMLRGELKKHLVKTALVAEAEVEAMLAEHDAARQKPERRRLRLLLKRVPAGADAETKATAQAQVEALRRRLVGGASFSELARSASDSQTRDRGGLLGTFTKEALPPALREAAFGLEAGGVSQVLASEQGFALLQCEKIVAGRTMPLDEARERIVAAIRRKTGEELWRQLVNELLGDSVRHDLDRLADASGSPGDVISRFEDGQLTRQQVAWLAADGETQVAVGPASSNSWLVRLLDGYVREFVAAREATRRGLDQDARVTGRIAWGSRAALFKAYRERRIEALFHPPSEQAVREFFEANREQFLIRPRYRLAVLWDGTPPDRRAEKYRQLLDAIASIELDELSFSAAARRLSSHPRADASGELGWRTRKQVAAWGPAALRAVEQLEVGAMSHVVEEPGALWVFKLLERDEARPLPWSEARGQVQSALERQLRIALTRDLMLELATDFDVREVAGEVEG